MEYKDLSTELRNILKARGITYKEIANQLEMSESGVKKTLTSKDISFNKLENILKIAKIDFKTLLSMADDETKRYVKLTKEQDDFFHKNIKHYNFLVQLQHFEMDIKILKKTHPKMPHAKIEKYITDLENIGLIKRHENTIQSEITNGFRHGKKLEETILKHTNKVFLKKLENIDNGKKNSSLFYGVGKFSLSPESLIEFKKAQKALLREFAERSTREAKIHSKKDLLDIGFLQASIPLTIKELYPID